MLNAEIVNKDEEIIRFVDELLENAVRQGVSDVHIEPQTEFTRVRFRKDGKLYIPDGYDNIPKQLHEYIIARIKYLTGSMKFDLKDQPQAGRLKCNIQEKDFIFTAFILPTIHGESLNIRNMDDYLQHHSLEELLNNDNELIEKFRRNINKKEGLSLFTGPTTSGKSTFITSVINELSSIDFKIITVEDPVKIQLPNTEQLKGYKDGEEFTNFLRAACWSDSDMLYIGDLRSFEVAHIALEMSSIKGFKVISTLHTIDAISALTRFEEMGIKRYLIASGVEFIVNIRRTKKLCPNCKEKADLLASEFEGIGLTPDEIKKGTFYQAKGCEKCFDTGYTGKLALVEMLEFTRTLKDSFVKGADPQEIARLAKEEGVYYTLEDDTRRKFLNGDIDLEAARMFTL